MLDKYYRVGSNIIPQWNSNAIKGVLVDDANIGNGRILKYNSVSENLEYGPDDTSAGSSGYAANCGYRGNSANGRWLEFQRNLPSNKSPFIIPANAFLKALSVSVRNTATVTFTIYKNGGSIETLVIGSSKKAVKSSLAHSLDAADEISVKVTSGTCMNPLLAFFAESR